MHGPHDGFRDTLEMLVQDRPIPGSGALSESLDRAGRYCFATTAPEAQKAAAPERWRAGEMLLATAWTALSSTRSEMVDIHLRSGAVIEGTLAVRTSGAVGEASIVRGQWTHMFALEDVMMVHHVPRGGRKVG